MSETEGRWSICPIEECEYAEEYDSASAAICPDCGMELLSACPGCEKPVTSPTQTSCSDCGKPLKE